MCNLVNIPTDCPERERRGWTADAYAVCEAETVNFDLLNFYYQWFASMEDCQRGNGWIPVELPMFTEECLDVDWPAACVIIPSVLYGQYGDQRFLRRFYPMMKKYVDMLLGICDETFGIADMFLSYKDWLAPEKATSGFIGRAYFYRCTSLLAKTAKILGYREDASSYGRAAEDMKEVLNRKYLHREKGGVSYDNHTQSANAHALFFEICPKEDRKAVAKALVENIRRKGTNTTGFMGTMCMLDALAQNGYSGEAFRLLMNPNQGGWLIISDVKRISECVGEEEWTEENIRKGILKNYPFEYVFLEAQSPEEYALSGRPDSLEAFTEIYRSLRQLCAGISGRDKERCQVFYAGGGSADQGCQAPGGVCAEDGAHESRSVRCVLRALGRGAFFFLFLSAGREKRMGNEGRNLWTL